MGKLYNSPFAQQYFEDVSFFRRCTFNLGGGGEKNNHFPQSEEGLISFLETQIMQHWLCAQ